MKRLLQVGAALTLAASSAAAQTRAELADACETLARLTHAALRENRSAEVVLFMNTATVMRARLGDARSCEAEYFATVRTANFERLSSATSVISVASLTPIRGWKHREVEEWLRATEGKSPSRVVSDVKNAARTDLLIRDVENLKIDIERLKRGGPGVITPPAVKP